MYKIEEISKEIILSQPALIAKIEELQLKYYDEVANIEYYPVMIQRCEDDKTNSADKSKIKELDGLIASHNRNCSRSKQNLVYFVDKIKSLQALLTPEAIDVMTMKVR